MNTMKHFLYLMIVLIITALYSCNKCKQNTYRLNQKQLDFTNFKEGSYWIMRDSITGVRDSIVLTSIDREYYEYKGPNTPTCPNIYERKILEFKGYLDTNQISLSAIKNDNSIYIRLPYMGSPATIFLSSPIQFYTQNNRVYNNVYASDLSGAYIGSYNDTGSISTRINTDSLFIKLRFFTQRKFRVFELEYCHFE